ncbi:Ovotransferrin [Varanus komodoensis]|nr:Ovotransferrin [Varanus komodoensis]
MKSCRESWSDGTKLGGAANPLEDREKIKVTLADLKSSGWATGYSAGDLELLCPDGSRAAVTDWQTCNLGPVPPSVVVARPMTVARVYDFLAKSQRTLAVMWRRNTASEQRDIGDQPALGSPLVALTPALPVALQEVGTAAAFRLFQSQKYEASDLLFKDATQRLIPVSHLHYEAILGQAFLQLAESIFSCTPAGILDFCKTDSCASSAQ